MIHDDDLRWAGTDLMIRRLWDEFERDLSRTWRGRLALRLARAWASLRCRVGIRAGQRAAAHPADVTKDDDRPLNWANAHHAE